VHGGNRWITETAPEEGRERDDGSGGTVAPGTLSLADMHRERENPAITQTFGLADSVKYLMVKYI
jgi:hypothetical protein